MSEGGSMYKVVGGVIGILVGGGLAFLVVVAAFARFFDNPDVAVYGPLFWGPPVGLVGGVIEAAIGVVVGGRLYY
jgi:hypothetical protein